MRLYEFFSAPREKRKADAHLDFISDEEEEGQEQDTRADDTETHSGTGVEGNAQGVVETLSGVSGSGRSANVGFSGNVHTVDTSGA